MTVLCSSNASLRDRQLKPNYIILFITLWFLVGLPLLDLFTLQPTLVLFELGLLITGLISWLTGLIT